MKTKSEVNDTKFDTAISAWKQDFEAPNPFLSEKTILSQTKVEKRIIPFKLSKTSIAAIITIGIISGFTLFSISNNFAQKNESAISEETTPLIKYKNEMYISELKHSEIENLLSGK